MATTTRPGKGLHYDIPLPEKVDNILDADFWMLKNIRAGMLKSLSDPVKFSASTSIFVRRGSFSVEINLIRLELEGPCIVNIGADQILCTYDVSDDFDAAFVVLSKRFKDSLMMFFSDPKTYNKLSVHQVIKVPDEIVADFEKLFETYEEIQNDPDPTYRQQALLFTTLGFLYRKGLKCYDRYSGHIPSNTGRLSEAFLRMAQEHFRENRFVDFYANALEVTSKHLSRTVKAQTGFTALEWLERFIILEAQVLLKSSNLHIQQIADQLHFPSQSVFGKFFKKATGLSPREFRNLR